MNVVHVINDVTHGAAARTTIDLHLKLRQLEVQSFILTSSTSNIPYSETYSNLEKFQAWGLSRSLMVKKKKDSPSEFFSIDALGSDIADHPLIREADAIHLHLVTGFLSSASIAGLASLNKPLIWTIHDLQPLTGGCHYLPAKCDRFMKTCGECPQLEEEPLNYTAKNLEAMTSAVAAANPVFICPSQWTLQQASKSRVTQNLIRHYIPNGVDCNVFQPLEKAACRTELNLDQNAWYILLTAKKVPSYALEILDDLRQYPITAKAVAAGQIKFLYCGADASRFAPKGWQGSHFDDVSFDRMALFYNSADIFLFTSWEQTFANGVLEAMACGTPVVSPRVGSTPEILNQEPLSACLFDTENTAEAIALIVRLFRIHKFYEAVSTSGINRVTESYSLEKHAAAYRQLYVEVLAQTRLQSMRPLSTAVSIEEGSTEALVLTLEKMDAGYAEFQVLLDKLKNQLTSSDGMSS